MIDVLAKKIKAKEGDLEIWYQNQLAQASPPITASVDLRNAGFKMVAVDTNIFPSGFQHLCKTFRNRSAETLGEYFRHEGQGASKVLIVTEGFTRNLPYWESVLSLKNMIEQAGLQVRVGFPGHLPRDPHEILLPSGTALRVELLKSVGTRVQVKDFDPDFILLNNDCSDGIPMALQGTWQKIYPSPLYGWHRRRKFRHFLATHKLTQKFAAQIGEDPWRMLPITSLEQNVHLDQRGDLERLAAGVKRLLDQVNEKYKEYGIKDTPYVFIKSDVGTFGLGQIHTTDPSEILNLGRRAKANLLSSKGDSRPTNFLIQEGVPTIDQLEGAPIEPILYFVGAELVGGFFRVHQDRDVYSSLNAPGATFKCLCFHKVEECKVPDLDLHCGAQASFFCVAKWLGKIALLASAQEI